MNNTNVRVVKIGGSLLSHPDLKSRVERWLLQQTAMHTVWVVGGGRLVDTVREFQLTHASSANVTDQQAHWISVDLMSVTARMFWLLFPQWSVVDALSDILHSNGTDHCIFDCSLWMRSVETLSANWEATSDSIAATLAGELNCSELYLLKSRSAAGDTVKQNVTEGVVDRAFSLVDDTCSVTIVNFQSEHSFESTRTRLRALG